MVYCLQPHFQVIIASVVQRFKAREPSSLCLSELLKEKWRSQLSEDEITEFLT